jgi:signal transduction histidine kinase
VKQSFSYIFILLLIFSSCNKNKSRLNDNISFANFNLYDRETKFKKLDSIEKIVTIQEEDSTTLKLLFDLSTEYYHLNEDKKSLNVALQALNIAKKINDSTKIAKAYYYIGDSYETTKKDSAYFYYLKAEKLYFSLQEEEKIARMQFNKGYILFFESNFTECEVELIKSLNNLKNSDNLELKFYVLNLLGICQEKLEEFEVALKYHDLAKKEIEKMKKSNFNQKIISNFLFTTTINTSNIYDSKREYQKSITNLNLLINQLSKEDFPIEYHKALNNLAYSKMKSGDFNDVENMLITCLDFATNENNKTEILYTKINLGEYYLLTKDTVQAIEMLKNSLEIANQIESNNEQLKTLKLLAEADIENSAVYKGKYITIADELAKKQLTNRNKYARIEYETSRIEDENKMLSEKNLRLITSGTILGFLTVVFFFYRYQKTQKREYLLVKLKKEAEEQMFDLVNKQQLKVTLAKEEEQNRIAKELHDNIMNKIYAVRLNLGHLNEKNDQESQKKRMQHIEELQNLEKEIRQISHNLKIDEFHEYIDFTDLIEELIETENNIGTTKFELNIDKKIDWTQIPTLVKVNLYRILQETLTNVVKYANASLCSIEINQNNNEILIKIHDDGIGFNINETKKGIGMKNIFERVKEIDGKINLKSNAHEGTEYNISLKINTI